MTMPDRQPAELMDRIDRVIDRYELSRQQNPNTDLAEFLPDRADKQYASIALELLRVDLQYSWQSQNPRSLRTYQTEFADLLSDKQNLRELAYEEYRMRRMAGELADPAEYQSKYEIETKGWPQFGDSTVAHTSASEKTTAIKTAGFNGHPSIPATAKGQHESTQKPDPKKVPEVGDQLYGFQLVKKLGQGAFASVYLAKQKRLADRLVVLKISPESSVTDESQYLAKLQHTNIVPIHSVHDFGDYHAVCMPFFGVCTLNEITKQVSARNQQLSGKIFQQTLAARHEQLGIWDQTSDVDVHPRIEHLAELTYVNACCKIILQVALALRFAHQQGIVHGDIKPANVLLADHGVAMLLDFNLSNEFAASDPQRSIVGGTLPYLSPEHLDAIAVGKSVGTKSDIFSLGAVFYQLLTGKLPFPSPIATSSSKIAALIQERRKPLDPASKWNANVNASLSAVVSKMIAVSERDRYDSIEHVCDDLQLHLLDRPLKHVRTPISERFQKWRRRHPKLTSVSATIAASLIVVGILVALLLAVDVRNRNLQYQLQTQKTQAALSDSRVFVSVPAAGRDFLQQAVKNSEDAIHYFVTSANGQLEIKDPKRFNAATNTALAEHLYLASKAAIRLSQSESNSQQALHWLERAAKYNTFGQSIASSSTSDAFKSQQSRIVRHLAATNNDTSETTTQSTPLANLKTADPLFTIYERIDSHQAATVIDDLRKLQQQDPHDLSICFLLGNAYRSAARFAEAEACFDLCELFQLDPVAPLLQRGLCRFHQKKYSDAESDFTTVIERNPVVPAFINRALTRQQLKRYQDAIVDLDAALELGAIQTRIYFIRSELKNSVGDFNGAKQDFQIGLKKEPCDVDSWVWRGLRYLATDVDQALHDFRAATKLNPNSHAAWLNIAYVLSEKKQQPDQAIAILDQLIKRNELPMDLAGRGVILARQGNTERALRDAKRVLELQQDSNAHIRIASIYALLMKHEPNRSDTFKTHSIQHLEQAILQNPNWVAVAKSDPDLRTLRNTPEFKAMLQRIAMRFGVD